jgi:type I restriction enzyme M protein
MVFTQRNETPEEYVRQEIAKSLVREYEYPRSRIAVEFTLRVGSRKPRADLVIFQEDRRDQSDAFIIVECKSEKIKSNDRKEGVGQLHSYMAARPNSQFGMWTNGLERHCFRRLVRDGNVSFDPVPDIPAMGVSEDFFERPRFDQLKAASSDALLFAFRRCHNYIAGNQGLQKPEAFWELLKVIFCKIHDERASDVTDFYATSTERHGLNGNMKVRSRLEKLFSAVKADYPTIFASGETIELNPPVLAYVVSQLQMYSLLESDVDVKGRAYEEIVGANLRGDRGEFFTPRNICKMAVQMLGPREDQLILDPACGTGGFLISAMNYVIESIRDAEIRKWGETSSEPRTPFVSEFSATPVLASSAWI